MRTSLVIRLLGPVEVTASSGPVSVGGPKARAVLAMLAMVNGRSVSIDHLVDGVWGEAAPENARSALQVYVSGIRKALRQVLGPDGWALEAVGGYRLRMPADAVDLPVFESLVEQADGSLMRGDYPSAHALAERAMALWSGAPLAGVEGAPFAAVESTRLIERLLLLRELWADATLALGRPGDVITALEPLLAEHPYTESLWRRQMLALYRVGRQADALAAFDRLRRLLDDELGLDPSPEVVALHHAMLRQDPSLQPEPATASVAQEHSAPSHSFALPWFGDELIGRRLEVKELSELFRGQRARVVVVLGPGGSGKTRLAVDVARGLGDEFGTSICFVNAAALDSAQGVLTALARAFGVAEQADPVQGLATALAGGPALALVDNVDHLANQLGGTLGALLGACPGLRLLLTSRVASGIAGEERYVVPELVEDAAIDLFVSRGRKAVRSLDATDAEVRRCAAQICHRVDRLPLAIELAAARLRMMTLPHLVEHLDASVLALSESSPSEERHRSVQAVVQWSYDLLSESAQRALRQLSICEGGFTVEVAAAILSEDEPETLNLLSILIDNSLVVAPWMEEALAAPSSAPRFRILEPIRQFGRALLGSHPEEEPLPFARLGEFLLRVLRPNASLRETTDRDRSLLKDDLPNVRMTIDWFAENDPNAAVDLVKAALQPALQLLLGEWLTSAAAQLVANADLDATHAAEIQAIAGIAHAFRGERDRALHDLISSAPTLLQSKPLGYLQIHANSTLAERLAEAGRHDEAHEVLNAVLERLEDDDVLGLLMILDQQQRTVRYRGEYSRAVEISRQVLSASASLTDATRIAHYHEGLAEALLYAGQLDEALVEAETVLRMTEITAPAVVRSALATCGRVAACRGDVDSASTQLRKIIQDDLADGVATQELGWLALALADSDPLTAARLLGAAFVLNEYDIPPQHLAGDKLDRLVRDLPSAIEDGRDSGWPGIVRYLGMSGN